MFDMNNFKVVLGQAFNSDPDLIAAHNKLYLGEANKDVIANKPHVRLSINESVLVRSLGKLSISSVFVTFDVFSYDSAQCDSLVLAIGDLYQDDLLVLTNQIHVDTVVVGTRSTVEGNEDKSLVYRGAIDLVFRVRS